MLPLGTVAPGFTLPDVETGQILTLDAFAACKALLVIFLCNHCPYVIHVREELARIARDYTARSVGILGIISNDVKYYPDDAPEATRPLARMLGFPIVYDESQAVAKAYEAACTPDFFLFDAQRRLVYRGQLDATRPGRGTSDGRDLRAALDALLAGLPVDPDQTPATGCNIKWKKEHFGV